MDVADRRPAAPRPPLPQPVQTNVQVGRRAECRWTVVEVLLFRDHFAVPPLGRWHMVDVGAKPKQVAGTFQAILIAVQTTQIQGVCVKVVRVVAATVAREKAPLVLHTHPVCRSHLCSPDVCGHGHALLLALFPARDGMWGVGSQVVLGETALGTFGDEHSPGADRRCAVRFQLDEALKRNRDGTVPEALVRDR